VWRRLYRRANLPKTESIRPPTEVYAPMGVRKLRTTVHDVAAGEGEARLRDLLHGPTIYGVGAFWRFGSSSI
jgi:hypothetical protein